MLVNVFVNQLHGRLDRKRQVITWSKQVRRVPHLSEGLPSLQFYLGHHCRLFQNSSRRKRTNEKIFIL